MRPDYVPTFNRKLHENVVSWFYSYKLTNKRDVAFYKYRDKCQ